MKKIELIANAIVIGGWALGLLLLAGAFIAWFLGWDVKAKRLVRRVRARRGKPSFERSASWWVERHSMPVARHRAPVRPWLDPSGRARAVRYWARVVAWGARRELAVLERRRLAVVAALADRPLYGAGWVTA